LVSPGPGSGIAFYVNAWPARMQLLWLHRPSSKTTAFRHNLRSFSASPFRRLRKFLERIVNKQLSCVCLYRYMAGGGYLYDRRSVTYLGNILDAVDDVEVVADDDAVCCCWAPRWTSPAKLQDYQEDRDVHGHRDGERDHGEDGEPCHVFPFPPAGLQLRWIELVAWIQPSSRWCTDGSTTSLYQATHI